MSQVLDDDMLGAEESRIVDDEDEMSYIYGDEDSEHHKLEHVEESDSDSWENNGTGYDSGGDAGKRRASTPDLDRRSDTEEDRRNSGNSGNVHIKVTRPNGSLEMKAVASSSVNEDE